MQNKLFENKTFNFKNDKTSSLVFSFSKNALLTELFGVDDKNLIVIEKELKVKIRYKGNAVIVYGERDKQYLSKKVLEIAYNQLLEGQNVEFRDIRGILSVVMSEQKKGINNKNIFDNSITIRDRVINPRSIQQQNYINCITTSDIIFALGPAGTGKTYIAIALAVSLLLKGKIDKIILSRPFVEAGERLGFLPGDLKEKADPYLGPLYDALFNVLPADQVLKKMDNKEIEIAPLAFMRGRTLNNVFAILDEGQNATSGQMKMFLTRLGENSKMIITGDPSQIDLPKTISSGLTHASGILKKLDGVSVINFSENDVERHSLVKKIVSAYSGSEN